MEMIRTQALIKISYIILGSVQTSLETLHLIIQLR